MIIYLKNGKKDTRLEEFLPSYIKLYNKKSFQEDIFRTKGDSELIRVLVYQLLKEESAYAHFNHLVSEFQTIVFTDVFHSNGIDRKFDRHIFYLFPEKVEVLQNISIT